jgi:glycosyltransferase involved in cell wall biosynthesis
VRSTMKTITIVHLITGLQIGGAEIMLYKLLSRMDRGRFRNLVVCMTDEGQVGEWIRCLGIEVHTLRMRRARPSLAAALRMVGLLWRERPAILQTWLYHADLLGLLTARLAGCPAVVWNIRSSNLEMSQPKRLLQCTIRTCARLSRHPDAIVVNSVAGRRDHRRIGYHPRAWVLIPNGFDTERFRPDPAARCLRSELGLNSDTFLIGLVARFDPLKDHTTFLKAASLLHSSRPEVHFVLVGRDVTLDNPELGRLIEQGKLTGAIHLLGERHDVPRLMAALDLATSCSVSEGFPNAVGEAMASAVPCVATDVGDSALLVGDTGVVVPPSHPGKLAAAWEHVVQLEPTERQRIGEAARQRIVSTFGLDAITRRYQDLYEKLAVRCVA